MKSGLKILIALMIVSSLLTTVHTGRALTATETSHDDMTITMLLGEGCHELAQSLASSITGYTPARGMARRDKGDTAEVVIVSGSGAASEALAARAVQRGAITVIVNPSDIGEAIGWLPSFEVTRETMIMEVDPGTGELISSEVVGEAGEATTPIYLASVYLVTGELVRISDYAVLEDCPEQRSYVCELVAERVASLLVEPGFSTQAASGQWVKRYDREGYLVLEPSGNQVYGRYEIYQLDIWDVVSNKEYWRIDPYIDHYLPTYQKTLSRCGPYMNERRMIVDAQSAGLYKYDPQTTPGDYGASVNIVFAVSTQGGTVGVGYSWSWSNPGVTYLAQADYANSKMQWVEQFVGPNYFWYPWYSGPTPAAHNSYYGAPSVVMRTDYKSGLSLSELRSSVRIYDDYLMLISGFLWIYRVQTNAHFTPPLWHLSSIFNPPGGGGCPALHVWDGSDYVEEGFLDIHNPEAVDVVYTHALATSPERVDGAYRLRLVEHPLTTSYIDQIKLYAILEDGTRQVLPLRRAHHSEEGNVLPMLLHSDDWRVDLLGAEHNDGISQTIDLEFAALDPNADVIGFIFEIEGHNPAVKY